MDSILDKVLIFALGLLGLSFLVTIHELGHFLVAKWNNVKVNTFSIGFGKKLIRFKKGETEYCISAIPFGGYVAMAGENPDKMEEGQTLGERDFMGKSVGARAAIAFAGPFVNILFAFILLMVLYMVGVQEPVEKELIIGFVGKNSPAEVAGILPGDTITAINGKPTEGWDDFREQIGVSLGANVELDIRRNGDVKVTVVPEELVIPPRDSTASETRMGIGDIGIFPQGRIFVAKDPFAESAAKQAGILAKDTIFEINGRHIGRVEDVVNIINGSKGEEVVITLLRGDSINHKVDTLKLAMKASFDESTQRYMVGIPLGTAMYREMHEVQRGPIEAFQKTCATSWKMTTSIFRYFGRLFQGQVKVDAFSGPVTIVAAMGNVWKADFQEFLMFLALISINLGIMNLLPLAITDGGLLLFLLIEKLRGKPLSTKTQAIIQNVAATLFIGFFLFITVLDFGKLSLFLN